MTIDDVLDNIEFTDPNGVTFSALHQLKIVRVLEEIYDESPTGRAILDKIASSPDKLNIFFEKGKAQVPAPNGEIAYTINLDVDFAEALNYVNFQGLVFNGNLKRVLMHEIIHAVEKKSTR